MKITNKKQFEKLVSLMDENPVLARGKAQFGSSKQDVKDRWNRISIKLNSLDFEYRTNGKGFVPKFEPLSILGKYGLLALPTLLSKLQKPSAELVLNCSHFRYTFDTFLQQKPKNSSKLQNGW